MSEQPRESSAAIARVPRGAADLGPPQRGPGPPRVIVTPLHPPLVHPLSKRDVQLVLSVLPSQCTAGLRSVSLLDERVMPDGTIVFASYRRDGFLRLHAVPTPPWPLGSADPVLLDELRQYDARIETESSGACSVSWPGDSLRLFYVMGVLLPGVARHRRERDGSRETDVNIRCLAPRDEPYWVTEEALRQWRDLLRRSAGP